MRSVFDDRAVARIPRALNFLLAAGKGEALGTLAPAPPIAADSYPFPVRPGLITGTMEHENLVVFDVETVRKASSTRSGPGAPGWSRSTVGLDLPVVKYRAMAHGLAAPLLTSRDFRARMLILGFSDYSRPRNHQPGSISVDENGGGAPCAGTIHSGRRPSNPAPDVGPEPNGA